MVYIVGIYDTQKNILTPSQRAKATPIYCMLWRQESFTFTHFQATIFIEYEKFSDVDIVIV